MLFLGEPLIIQGNNNPGQTASSGVGPETSWKDLCGTGETVMKTEEKLNLTMLCDFYELTMGNGYFRAGLQDRITYFDVFFRNVPDNGGFAVCAGLEQLVQYIQNLHFDEEDIAFLRDKHLFSEDFLSYLRDFRFTGDIWAVPEGRLSSPGAGGDGPGAGHPGPADRDLHPADHQPPEPDRHQGQPDRPGGPGANGAGVRLPPGPGHGRRHLRSPAAYIGGCAGTACTISDQLYGVPAGGTMAHSWVQMFDSQYEAFKTYCQIYPHNATLLVDTYNVLKSGVPDAIRAFDEVLKPLGIRKCGIRLDSGDMAYLTQEARRKLDAAGWTECQISASNSLDEYIIQDLLLQGAKIDVFGVGERMITARSEPVFGGVYKLAAVEDGDGKIIPKIKVSETWTRSPFPTSRRPIGSLTTPPARRRRTTSPSGTRRWTRVPHWSSSIPGPPGSARPIRTLPQSPFRSRSFREESWSISCPPCRRSRPTAVPRWIPCGTR